MIKQQPRIPNVQRGFTEGWAILMSVVWRKILSSTMYDIPNLVSGIQKTIVDYTMKIIETKAITTIIIYGKIIWPDSMTSFVWQIHLSLQEWNYYHFLKNFSHGLSVDLINDTRVLEPGQSTSQRKRKTNRCWFHHRILCLTLIFP